jgi:hypothetical protein
MAGYHRLLIFNQYRFFCGNQNSRMAFKPQLKPIITFTYSEMFNCKGQDKLNEKSQNFRHPFSKTKTGKMCFTVTLGLQILLFVLYPSTSLLVCFPFTREASITV